MYTRERINVVVLPFKNKKVRTRSSMKIQGPDQTNKAGSSKKSEKTKSGGGIFSSFLGGSDDAQETTHTAASNTIARVDVLLAAQAAEDPAARASRQKMRRRADTILHELDKIRLGMLTGRLTVGNMIDIADVVASHREKIDDPQLAAILDEVDLRAQIEIAKMRQALDMRA